MASGVIDRGERMLIGAGVVKPKHPYLKVADASTFMCEDCGQISSAPRDAKIEDGAVYLSCSNCFNATRMKEEIWNSTERVRDRKIGEASRLLGNINTDDEVQQIQKLLSQAEKDRAANRYECPVCEYAMEVD